MTYVSMLFLPRRSLSNSEVRNLLDVQLQVEVALALAMSSDSQLEGTGVHRRAAGLRVGAMLIICMLGIITPWASDAVAAPLDPAQRAALIDLYNSTSGHLWTSSSGWLSGDPCAGWFGVKCDPGSNEVMYVTVNFSLKLTM